jgi:hypothetical protein
MDMNWFMNEFMNEFINRYRSHDYGLIAQKKAAIRPCCPPASPPKDGGDE